MWDWAWQDARDCGSKYDLGLFEVHPQMMPTFYRHNRCEPTKGWIGSVLFAPEKCVLPPLTELVDQKPWNDLGKRLGGIGATGRLQFTRGTIAGCYAIERAKPGSLLTLVGFDHVLLGRTLPFEQAFSQAYRSNDGTFSFAGHKANVSKLGNHDFGVERKVMEVLAARHGVDLMFAQDVW